MEIGHEVAAALAKQHHQNMLYYKKINTWVLQLLNKIPKSKASVANAVIIFNNCGDSGENGKK